MFLLSHEGKLLNQAVELREEEVNQVKFIRPLYPCISPLTERAVLRSLVVKSEESEIFVDVDSQLTDENRTALERRLEVMNEITDIIRIEQCDSMEEFGDKAFSAVCDAAKYVLGIGKRSPMVRAIVISLLCFSSVSVFASEESKCDLNSHDLSPFLEKREGLEKRFVVSAHDLMMSYCSNYSSSESLQSVFVKNGITNRDIGVNVLINAVKIVSPFFKDINEVKDNRQIFSYIRGFYQKKYQNAANEKEKQVLAGSFNMTSLATVEIMNFR